MTLYRVTAPHFCAGFVVSPAGEITRAAPILAWMLGKDAEEARLYCEKKRWGFELVAPTFSNTEIVHPLDLWGNPRV